MIAPTRRSLPAAPASLLPLHIPPTLPRDQKHEHAGTRGRPQPQPRQPPRKWPRTRQRGRAGWRRGGRGDKRGGYGSIASPSREFVCTGRGGEIPPPASSWKRTRTSLKEGMDRARTPEFHRRPRRPYTIKRARQATGSHCLLCHTPSCERMQCPGISRRGCNLNLCSITYLNSYSLYFNSYSL